MSLASDKLVQSLDFRALSEPVTNADIAAFKVMQAPGAKTSTVPIWCFGVIGGFILLTIIITVANEISGAAHADSSFLKSFSFVTVGVAMAAVLVWVSRARTKQLARLYKFASLNNLTLLLDLANPSYAGMIFDEGHSRQLNESLRFPDGLEIGNYTYMTGSGKNRQTYQWGFVRIKLARHLPNMVLDSRKNNLFGKISNLPDTFSRQQTLALEGDFNDFFTLYAPKEYERDALYVFTPDVMAAVIDAGKDYDMEVVDDNLLLYSTQKFSIDSEAELKKLLVIASKIAIKLRSQSAFYADEKVGDRAQNIVAQPGRRLKTGFNLWIVLIFVIAIVFQIWITSL